jgi:hypothetical protein
MQRRTLEICPQKHVRGFTVRSRSAAHDMNRKPEIKTGKSKIQNGAQLGPLGVPPIPVFSPAKKSACASSSAYAICNASYWHNLWTNLASEFISQPGHTGIMDTTFVCHGRDVAPPTSALRPSQSFVKNGPEPIKTQFCQKEFRRALACICAHRRAPTCSREPSSKNMCEVLPSAQSSARTEMMNCNTSFHPRFLRGTLDVVEPVPCARVSHSRPLVFPENNFKLGFLRGVFGCGETRLREYGLQCPMTETATLPQSKRPAGKSGTKLGHSWDGNRGGPQIPCHAAPRNLGPTPNLGPHWVEPSVRGKPKLHRFYTIFSNAKT